MAIEIFVGQLCSIKACEESSITNCLKGICENISLGDYVKGFVKGHSPKYTTSEFEIEPAIIGRDLYAVIKEKNKLLEEVPHYTSDRGRY